MRHPRDKELTRRDEGRQCIALHADDKRLVYLPADGDPRIREQGQAHELSCPVEDCGEPVYVRFGPNVRAHFVHPSGRGNHSPESLLHLELKLRVEAHLRSRTHTVLNVSVEKRTAGSRTPDVTAHLKNGDVGFEIQLATIQIPDLKERLEAHRVLLESNWIFLHGGRYWTNPNWANKPHIVDCNEVIAAILDAGHSVYFIERDSDQIWTIVSDELTRYLRDAKALDRQLAREWLSARSSELSTCGVDRAGRLTTKPVKDAKRNMVNDPSQD